MIRLREKPNREFNHCPNRECNSSPLVRSRSDLRCSSVEACGLLLNDLKTPFFSWAPYCLIEAACLVRTNWLKSSIQSQRISHTSGGLATEKESSQSRRHGIGRWLTAQMN